MWTRDDFMNRLTELRLKKDVSARVMSQLSGLGEKYISNLENSDSWPTMSAFFAICDYLGITPKEFFDTDVDLKFRNIELYQVIMQLPDDCIDSFKALAENVLKHTEGRRG